MTSSTQVYINIATGKYTNPYLNVATVNLVDRKIKDNNFPLLPHNIITEYLPLLSPYTRVYGMREVPKTTNSTLYKKSKTSRDINKNTNLQSNKESLYKLEKIRLKISHIKLHMRKHKENMDTKTLASINNTTYKHINIKFKTYNTT